MSIEPLGFGLDVGNVNTIVAFANKTGVDILTNEFGKRQTATCITFDGRTRIIGADMKTSAVEGSVVINSFMPLLATRMNYVEPDDESYSWTAKWKSNRSGRVCVNVTFAEHQLQLIPEQLLAMQFIKVREIVKRSVDVPIPVDLVTAIPSYYSSHQRQAVLDAASVAHLNCKRLVNSTTAAGVFYALNKNWRSVEASVLPSCIAVIDVGCRGTDVAIMSYAEGELSVIARTFDAGLGGVNFTMVLFDKFLRDFEEKYGCQVPRHSRETNRLFYECEKVKIKMSGTGVNFPVRVDNLAIGHHLEASICRATFEELAKVLLERYENLVRECIARSGLRPEKIQTAEMIGGSSRIPALRNITSRLFGRSVSVALSAEEVVAKGCALLAAADVGHRKFTVKEVCSSSIFMCVGSSARPVELFHTNDVLPGVRSAEIDIGSSANLTFYYPSTEHMNRGQQRVGTYTIETDSSGVRVKVKTQVDDNGIFTVKRITSVDEKDAPRWTGVDEPSNAMVKTDEPSEREVENDTDKESECPNSKIKVKKIDDSRLTEDELSSLRYVEDEISRIDSEEQDRLQEVNALESEFYTSKARLYEEYSEYITVQERQKIEEIEHKISELLEHGGGEHVIKRLTGESLIGEISAISQIAENRRTECLESIHKYKKSLEESKEKILEKFNSCEELLNTVNTIEPDIRACKINEMQKPKSARYPPYFL
ncbi:unnamed protein product [Calicophoron daubneyi]|uniref:Uncharacterized protein n=1 Tax=Calicophoron daubneyi TaxID=300641 RepID=A0AAV2T8T4_CALDB